MCGIAGIVHFSGKTVEQADLKKMTDAIAHRGPNGEGFFTDGNLGFGHRRLAIIDLSNAANQPMEYEGCVLIFNGEIYNYIELRAILSKEGYVFKTSSDSEVLLAAYKCWGHDCVSYFNGMWSFALYDRQLNQLFFSRDRFGKKPLYYSYSSERIIFCSEIKGLLTQWANPKANLKAVCGFIGAAETDCSAETFFEGIVKLPAGCSAILDLQSFHFEISRYYVVAKHMPWQFLTEVDTIRHFQDEFQRSVNWRLRSDVEIGISLSGGLDSAYLASVAAKQSSKGIIRAFTASSIAPELDESIGAQIVARQCGLQWSMTKPGIKEFYEDFEKVVFVQEEPFDSPSVFMQHRVMQLAHEAGVQVLLGGQGADEILLGYLRHIYPWLQALSIGDRAAVLRKLAFNNNLSLPAIMKLYFYFSNAGLRRYRQLLRWSKMRKQFSRRYLDFFHERENAAASKKSLFDFQVNELVEFSLPKLLRYEDKNAMAFGIESRLPYLDFGVVEAVLNAPNEIRMKNGWTKYILRKAMEQEMPHSIVYNRRKIGFAAPESYWLAEWSGFETLVNSSELMNKLFSKPLFPVNDLRANWRLVAVAAWEKAFGITT